MDWDWKKFYDKAYDWILDMGPRFIVATVVMLIGWWLIRLFNKWLKSGLERKKFNPTLRYFLLNLVAISLQVLLVLLALQVAGVQLTFFAAIVAGLSVAVGLALSGTLQNFVSGLLILILRPYSVGENVVMQGQEGTVTSVQLFYTTILTFDNKTIIVPNGQLFNNVIVNLSRQGKRRFDIEMKLSYDIKPEQVKKIIENIAGEDRSILDTPVFRVGVTDLTPDKYAVVVQLWINAHGFEDSKFLIRERVMTELLSAGIRL